MDVQGNDREKSRLPTIDDLEAVCRELNKHDVKYILMAGLQSVIMDLREEQKI